jgi:signal transduction histidine kinase
MPQILSSRIKLSRRIFQYFALVTTCSLILVGVIWIESSLKDYRKQVKYLKATYVSTKKTEIKNKVLQIKDYIYWVRNNPINPLSHSLDKSMQSYTAGINVRKTRNYVPFTLNDSVSRGQILLFYVPKKGMQTAPYPIDNRDEKLFVDRMLTDTLVQKGSLPYYEDARNNDSIPEAVIYLDKTLPGSETVVAILSSKEFDHLLQKYILDSLSNLRWAKDEYIIINRYDGQALLTNGKYNAHPVNILETGSKRWKDIFLVQQQSRNRPEGVFHTYKWPKLSSSGLSDKTSYFSYLPDWKWIIGTGFYEDDVNVIIDARKKELYNIIRDYIIKIILLQLALILLSYIIVLFISKRFQHNIELFTRFFEKAAHENSKIDVSKVTYDEFEHMARVANLMIDQRKKAQEEQSRYEREIQELNQTLEERVTKRTAQLTAMNEELQSFSYSISHDLRAPLRAILGFSQILAQDHRKTLDEEGKNFLDHIVKAGFRMEKLINDLLNYARLGRNTLSLHPVEVKEIIDAVHSDFSQKLQEIKADFLIENEIPRIKGDESLFMQIFTNLVDNSITYRKKEIPLKIVLSCEHLSGSILLKITDNGIGIPKESWTKIFNIFQRLHNDDQYPGTGIGLATVRKAVNLMEGRIWVDSEVGQGTTFFMKFPSAF